MLLVALLVICLALAVTAFLLLDRGAANGAAQAAPVSAAGTAGAADAADAEGTGMGEDWEDEEDEETTWGYTTADGPEDFEARLRRAFGALQASPHLAGFCYTQLADTMQEANGLADAHRRPKISAKVIREIVRTPVTS